MDRKPGDPHRITRGFMPTQESHGARKGSGSESGPPIIGDPFARKNPSSRLSNSDLEFGLGISPRHRQAPPGTRVESYQPQRMRPRSELEGTQPMPIPNAIPKRRLPVMDRNGYIYMLGSKAPHTEEEIKKMEEADERDRVLAENYRRMKQGVFKWDAERKERARRDAKAKNAESTSRTKSAMIKRVPSDESVAPREDIRVGNSVMVGVGDPVPDYQKSVMQPFSHQYGHTTAAIAYDQGFKDGFEKCRQKMERQRGGKYQHFLAFSLANP